MDEIDKLMAEAEENARRFMSLVEEMAAAGYIKYERAPVRLHEGVGVFPD